MAFDWNDLKPLIACADAGSLSGASVLLGVSQPTLGRRLDALEADLGVRLFVRSPRGVTLTATGRDLLAHAREVQAATARLSMAAAGRGEAISGTVRVTASALLATYRLPPILAALIEAEPGIEVELVVSDATNNLLLREADIAIRMYRPEQADLIARKVTEIETGLYASESYVRRRGMPTLATMNHHRMVGYDRDPRIRAYMTAAGLPIPDGFFALRTDDQVTNWRLAVAGAGIGAMQTAVAEAEPQMVRVLPEIAMPSLPVWLTVHEELRTSRLMRTVYDRLADALTKLH